MNNKEKYRYPKVLVISHNIFSETSSMGKTLCGIFGEWPKDSIAQLYLHSEIPTVDLCENYYRVTDFEVLHSIYTRKKVGTIFNKNDINKTLKSSREDKDIRANIYQIGRKRKPYMYLVRNLVWKLGNWQNGKLIQWIDDFKPDIIFFASGDYTFSYDITMKIATDYKIPIVTYICDDFYINDKKSLSLFYSINKIKFRNKFEQLMKYSSGNIYICDMMKNQYDKLFGKNGSVLMTTSFIDKEDININNSKYKVEISYIGTLGLDRWIPLVEIGKTLKSMFKSNIYINVYSTESRNEIVQHLTLENGIKFHGGIGAQEVKEVIEKSDILLHVESMDDENKERTRYSVSTKIADSLASGKCIFAYGPKEIASIKYLQENDAACVVTEKEQLLHTLEYILKNKKIREQYAINALNLAKQRHNKEINHEIIVSLINKVVDEWKGSYESTTG